MSAVDIVLGAALASTVALTVLSVTFAVQTILATRRMRTAATSSQPALGPYRVAGDGTIATVKCRVAVGFDPAKLAALTPEQRERVMAAIIDEAIRNVSSGEIAAEIRQKLDAVVADAKAGLARESEAGVERDEDPRDRARGDRERVHPSRGRMSRIAWICRERPW